MKRGLSKKFFDKYYFYKKSVQDPKGDVEFFLKAFEEVKGKKPKSLCEDFCGTFLICCEWVKMNKNHTAVGVDLDEEPIKYGMKNHFSSLSHSEKKRIKIKQTNVLNRRLSKTDIVAASNFSYFIFKKREGLREYFENCYRRLNSGGVFICDIFGGSQCCEPNEEETEFDGWSYYWDQDTFDPVTGESMFYIHFKPKGQKKREKVFKYDWRMWSIPEVRELLEEVGFKKTHVYWEGTTDDGEGDGDFTRSESGEFCESWIAYIAAEK